jgi:hypothetical protein
MNDYTHVRSEVLSVPSIEFFALVFAICYFLLFTKKTLIELYIIFVPFNDLVYRFASLQLSDIIAFLIILFNLKYLSSKLKYLYGIFPVLMVGSLVGLLQFGDYFGILYSLRLLLVFGAVNVISAHLQSGEEREAVFSLYKRVVWFSITVALCQVIFWYFGFSIAGIFQTSGIPRMKGLSHEPATFCFWLVLSLPFGFSGGKHSRTDLPYLFSLVVAILATGSITGIIASIAFAISLFVSKLKTNLNSALRYLFVVVLVTTIISFSSNSFNIEYFGEYTISKVDSYISQMFLGKTTEEANGRSGDKQLIKYFQDNPIFGMGAFRSSKIQEQADTQAADEYIAAANFYLTTIAEFGVVGTLLISCIFIRWGVILYRIQNSNNKFLGFALVAWVVSLAGLRVFGFHQPWLIMSIYASIPSDLMIEGKDDDINRQSHGKPLAGES